MIDSGRYYVNASKDDMHWFSYEVLVWIDGSISYIADHRNFCGDRYTNLTVSQTPGDIIVPLPQPVSMQQHAQPRCRQRRGRFPKSA